MYGATINHKSWFVYLQNQLEVFKLNNKIKITIVAFRRFLSTYQVPASSIVSPPFNATSSLEDNPISLTMTAQTLSFVFLYKERQFVQVL